jgi:hypothetical protein
VGGAGVLLDRADAPALTEALRRLLGAPDPLAALGRAGRERAVVFDLPAVATAFDRMVTALERRGHG